MEGRIMRYDITDPRFDAEPLAPTHREAAARHVMRRLLHQDDLDHAPGMWEVMDMLGLTDAAEAVLATRGLVPIEVQA